MTVENVSEKTSSSQIMDMIRNKVNDPLSFKGGGGSPQQALKDTIAGEQAKSNVAMQMAKQKEDTMRPLQEAKVERIGQAEEQQSGISKQLNTPFQVPQETVSDFSQLGGLVGIMGVMLGTSGKMSAQNVLQSATGILDGYKKGRADLIAQKQKEFETNMKRLTALSSQVQAELKTYMEKAAVKDQTAALSLETISAIANNGIIAEVVKGQSAFKIQEMITALANTSGAAESRKLSALQSLYTSTRQIEIDEETRKAKDRVPVYTSPEGPRNSKGELISGVPADATKFTTAPKAGSVGAKGAVAGQVGRINGAMSQVSGAIEALSKLPVTTSNPVFGQKVFGGLFTAPLSVINQKMTDETTNMMQTALIGVARNLATLETSGAATGLVGLTDKIEAAISIQKGAKLHVALYKLAEMRRIVEDSARTSLASSNYSPEEKKLISYNLKRVEEAIPFTQNDVTNAVRAGESNKLSADQKKMSFTEFAGIKFPTEEKSTPQIDPRAIERLKTSPDELRDAFDQKYGKGSADRVLGIQ